MDRTPPRHPTSWNLSAPSTCKQEMTSQVEAKHCQRSRHIRALSVALVLRTDSEYCYTRAVHSVMFRLSLAVVVKPFFLQNTSFTALDERMNLRTPRSRCGSRFKHVQNVCDILSKLSWFLNQIRFYLSFDSVEDSSVTHTSTWWSRDAVLVIYALSSVAGFLRKRPVHSFPALDG